MNKRQIQLRLAKAGIKAQKGIYGGYMINEFASHFEVYYYSYHAQAAARLLDDMAVALPEAKRSTTSTSAQVLVVEKVAA